MDVSLTPDQEAFIRHGLETGRYKTAEDAVREALSLWEERERARALILVAVDKAEHSLQNGLGRPITREAMQDLAEEIKKRGRRRLSTERSRKQK